jgi:hypothetical protein
LVRQPPAISPYRVPTEKENECHLVIVELMTILDYGEDAVSVSLEEVQPGDRKSDSGPGRPFLAHSRHRTPTYSTKLFFQRGSGMPKSEAYATPRIPAPLRRGR